MGWFILFCASIQTNNITVILELEFMLNYYFNPKYKLFNNTYYVRLCK